MEAHGVDEVLTPVYAHMASHFHHMSDVHL